jgi:hypothetical protein
MHGDAGGGVELTTDVRSPLGLRVSWYHAWRVVVVARGRSYTLGVLSRYLLHVDNTLASWTFRLAII